MNQKKQYTNLERTKLRTSTLSICFPFEISWSTITGSFWTLHVLYLHVSPECLRNIFKNVCVQQYRNRLVVLIYFLCIHKYIYFNVRVTHSPGIIRNQTKEAFIPLDFFWGNNTLKYFLCLVVLVRGWSNVVDHVRLIPISANWILSEGERRRTNNRHF